MLDTYKSLFYKLILKSLKLTWPASSCHALWPFPSFY